jgi:hypothetical protein
VVAGESVLTQAKYFIRCSHCDLTLFLLETSLAEIVQCRRASTTGDPLLTFLCPGCKHANQFDYENRLKKPAILSDEQYQDIEPAFIFVVGCGDGNCDSQVELIALCDPGTTKEQLWTEIAFWKMDGICCKSGHPIAIPVRSVAGVLEFSDCHLPCSIGFRQHWLDLCGLPCRATR